MSYYSKHLAGQRLRTVYDIAPPRIDQYLKAEIDFVRSRLSRNDRVLELGCGYGRVMFELARDVQEIIGIDSAEESLILAREMAKGFRNVEFHNRDALDVGFEDDSFDVVIGIQNSVCSFRVDQPKLFREALRVTVPGGRVMFSTYSDKIWVERLEWFEHQAERGLVGEIDYDQTTIGTIVCKDGLRLGRLTESEFRQICKQLSLDPVITEIDGSSLFCEVVKA